MLLVPCTHHGGAIYASSHSCDACYGKDVHHEVVKPWNGWSSLQECIEELECREIPTPGLKLNPHPCGSSDGLLGKQSIINKNVEQLALKPHNHNWVT